MKILNFVSANLKSFKYRLAAFVISTFFMSMPAHAAVTNDTGAIKILKNLMDLFKVGGQTVIIAGYTAGIISLLYAFWLFRSAGDTNSGGQNKGIYLQIALLCVAGAGCLYLGAMGQMAGETLLGTDAKTSSGINNADFGL
ncbi:hypothetical protein OCF84_20755 (plasmid) [Shewanella xiamenensis]|uniref:Uncharacterized protein n=1 Tax=Shewanella xiamenensis TaxID=332186 RepID=A0ABT6UFQ0_9GAMM|nr:hypothetical protein [Shewanella xiamenensis]MDI5833301.1 hypothetical protein [Shewanella xiamenensis]WHF57949.1 hypothetical protein OCF84_20755 [Shewanella xiamenensis]